MATKRRLSHEATARLAIAGGAVSLATAIGAPLLPEGDDGASVLGQILATGGVVAWFLGAAAGVLALSTPFAKRAAVGLALCGIAALIAIATVMLGR